MHKNEQSLSRRVVPPPPSSPRRFRLKLTERGLIYTLTVEAETRKGALDRRKEDVVLTSDRSAVHRR